MIKSRPFNIYFRLVALCLASASCSAESVSVESAAESYCRLYAPDYLKEVGGETSLQKTYAHILEGVRAIGNAQFVEFLNNIDASDFSAFYKGTKREISSLLGRDWECADFEDFFLPKQKVVYLAIDRVLDEHVDPKSEDNVVIIFLYDGRVLVDNSPLKDASISTIIKAVELSLGDGDLSEKNVIIYLDEGADGNRLSEVVLLLHGLGVKSFGLIDY